MNGTPRYRRGWMAAAAALIPAAAQAAGPPPAAFPDPPQALFQDLYVAVQAAPVFSDGKAFADAVPKAAPGEILAQYHALHPQSAPALERFVDEHFVLPAPAAVAPSPANRESIIRHIDGLWDQLTRRTPHVPRYASLLPLPKPYVVPGGRFREIYYWDSYFTMLGLLESGRGDLIADMIGDFAYFIDTYGHVPNGARTYYLSRSQPPFFFDMVALSAIDDPARAYARYLPELKREYAFWMQGARGLAPGNAYRRVVAMPDGSLLNRYWDDRDTPRDESFREDRELARTSGRPPNDLYRNIRAAAESGWDFSSRWFGDSSTRAAIDTTEIVPADLNSLLFGLESAIRSGCERRSDTVCALKFAARAAARRSAIDRYLWDTPSGAYLDYRWTRGVRDPHVTAATLYPLFVGMASPDQADRVAATVSRDLLKAGGLVTTTLDTGQQWDAPNGWAPLQWIGVAGLRRYHNPSLARIIACRWMANVNQVYRASGRLVEKYNVVDTGRSGGGGEYPTQDGFGWTNGVMRKLVVLYPADAGVDSPSECAKQRPLDPH
jgi:alpha,alpha-trehalase